ncbi:apses-domain-containing protein [Delitschia confertaspora ATCC 74209]|uniref:Apses-domain-containing protein n=1 Tax=Delitschia confertaspora ATCC 74209 TaxID=1513339 RepID=A0A9P4JN42_9PLEO|nr:apses-domain-containing protein [Delitschia confertaspora ATCC 74209]
MQAEKGLPKTVKLDKPELPPISSVHSRGIDYLPDPQYIPRAPLSSERFPAIQAQASVSSNSSSPRGGSFSSASVLNGSVGSNTSYSASVNGQSGYYKTPSPEQTPQSLNRNGQPLNAPSQQESSSSSSSYGVQQSYNYPAEGYNSMNQMQPYNNEVPPSHMTQGNGQAPSSVAPPSLSHAQYSYPPQQPPLMQPGPQYAHSSYPSYAYGNGVPSQLPVTSAMMNPSLISQSLPLPAMSAPANSSALMGTQPYGTQEAFDSSGQRAPPGMKPRVTATLWEDEGSLCFQVEAKGVCVARREDNHFINGTKLLNVAGMTRGRRDGILKSEKTRHVVKIGPMHLKGVWIPFDRALEFANKEKITDQLYPLFVHDIGALLYHPTNNQGRGSVPMGNLRRPDPMAQRYLTAPNSQPPPLHHHHSMSTSVVPMSQPPHAAQPYPSAARPGLERAQTFPTPPTSANSTGMMSVGGQGSSYDWSSSAQNMQGSQPLTVDTMGANARSVPNTPASTPPANVQQPGMPYQTAQGYDTSRPIYSAAPSQSTQYNTQSQPPMYQMQRENTYPKPEMAPPTRAPGEQQDVKPVEGILAPANEQSNHAQGDEEAEHENENEYTHTTTSYSANRGPYAYSSGAAPQPLHGEHPHLSPEMTGSPHQNGSGRATPRTTGTAQTQWASYPTSQRQSGPSSNLYSVMDNRTSTNGNPPQASYQTPQYANPAYANSNGAATNIKRGRDEDDEQDPYGRPSSQGVNSDDIDGIKRRKTISDGSVGGAVGAAPYNQDPTANLQRRTTISQRSRGR